VFLFAGAAFAQEAQEKPQDKPEQKETPVVEVVFVLDTTGSMSGLIEGAKNKIWSIVNHIAEGEPTPDIKVGLVGYRDRKDKYVTKLIGLSDDLDNIFKELRSFKAQGGGDQPESVNQALHEAVTKISWSTDDKTLRVVFLVGDAPPHMDYKDDVKYQESCKKAVKKDIIINTVQCGGIRSTTPIWQEIAKLGEGVFVQIAQSGGMVAVTTPYDKELAKLSRELDDTTVLAGEKEERDSELKKMDEASKETEGFSGGAAADRAAYKAKKAPSARRGRSTKDLVTLSQNGKLDLDKVKEEELPEEMKKMTKEERKKYIEKKVKEREETRKKIEELSKKRDKYIKKELAKKSRDAGGFDEKVIEAVKKHAHKKGITYKKEEKKEEPKEEKKEEAPKKK
jgi:hypothetical protein